MSGRIRRMTAREVESILRRYDFLLISKKVAIENGLIAKLDFR